MAESAKNINQRLENIRSIQPLVEAFRTISLAKWRSSLSRIHYLENFQEKLVGIHQKIPSSSRTDGMEQKNSIDRFEWLFLIGSQRGFCGNFNQQLIKRLQEELSARSPENYQLYVYGKKIRQILEKSDIRFSPFPVPLNIEQIERDTVTTLLEQEGFLPGQHEISLLYNKYTGAGRYETILESLFPIQTPLMGEDHPTSQQEYIFDTDLDELRDYLEQELLVIRMMNSFLSAAASEYSTRFQIMENAVENADDLVEELMVQAQEERRKKITSDMHELAVGAGLLGKKK